MEYFRRNLWWIGSIALAGGYLTFFYTEPCESPITYTIGRVDEGFGLSEEKLLSSINEAAAIWSEPIGKPLFTQSAQGKVTINLIYDDRQKTTQAMQNSRLT